MLRLKARLDRLEKTLAPANAPRERLRLVIHGVSKSANLANATCKRTLTNGVLMELVDLHGSREGLTDEELDKFVESFPIETGQQGDMR